MKAPRNDCFVNTEALSLYSFYKIMKKIVFKCNLTYWFKIYCMYIAHCRAPRAPVDTPSCQQKLLITSVICC